VLTTAERLDVLERAVTAAFDPSQPRDKNGRWIDTFSSVHFSTGLMGKKRAGRVAGPTAGKPGYFDVVESGSGKRTSIRSDKLEVIDARARLDTGLDEATRGLIDRTSQRLGPGAPSAPAPAPAPAPVPEAPRPVDTPAPVIDMAQRAPSLPGRKTAEEAPAGERFHAKGPDGQGLQLLLAGKARRSDGGWTIIGHDQEGNSHRVVVPPGGTLRTIQPDAPWPDTRNVPEPPKDPQKPGTPRGNATLEDLEAEAAANGEIVLYHGGLPEGTGMDDIDLGRAGSQQNKKGKSYGGFYLTDPGSKDWSTDYARGRNGVMHGFRVSKDAKVGDLGSKNIDRLSANERASLAEQFDVVKGKDTMGRDQYVLLNKDAISGVGETNVGLGRTGNVGTRPVAAALLAAPPPAGGPAHRIAADYGAKSKKKGRKVATKAGEKRYGLPIGTPLGQGKAKNEQDAYKRFTDQKTPADLARTASYMSNGDLALTAKAVFGVKGQNEWDKAAQIALVKELAQRGIDPHGLGYEGGFVALNPNPKKDPTIKAAKKPKASELPDSVDAEKLSDADLSVLAEAGWKGRADDQREALYAPENPGPLPSGRLSQPAKEMLLAQGWRTQGDQLVPPKTQVEKENERLAREAESTAKKAETERKKAEAEAEKARKAAERQAERERLAAEELATIPRRR